jgi:amidohydrolase
MMSELIDLARQELAEIVRLRRDFHSHPELSFQEQRTASVVRAYLESLGLSVVQHDGMHGMWADLRVPGATRTLAFRADMDALPMDEVPTENKKDFVSQNPGVAHTCGHDAHMAMLLGAARILSGGGIQPKHNIRFIFQHAEEEPPGGAQQLVEAGCLDGVDQVYGMHVIPPIPTGLFNVLPGPFMAAADDFYITVQGKGGHAAMPHWSCDPVVAGSHIVIALQQLIARRTSPFEPAVISVTTFRTPHRTHNVIPDSVELIGTARTMDEKLRDDVERWIGEVAQREAENAGCSAEVEYKRGYPVLVNDMSATERGRQAVEGILGPQGVMPDSVPLMAGEDFSYYASERPSCFVFLGTGNPAKGIGSPNHAVDFDVDEDALPLGTAWFLELASR